MENKKDIYKDLEKYSQELIAKGDAPHGAGPRAIRPKRQFYFPINKILITALICGGGYIYEAQRSPVERVALMAAVVDSVSESASARRLIGRKNVEKIQNYIEAEKQKAQRLASVSSAPTMPSSEIGGAKPQADQASQSQESNIAQGASEADFESGHYVQIGGQYYKYRPDNIYIINGQRVFFQSQRAPPMRRGQSSVDSAKAQE